MALKHKNKVAGKKVPTSLLRMTMHKRGNNIKFVNYYHIIQYFLSYLGEKPRHCIVSMFPHILEKAYQCRNINNKYDKLYQCIYDKLLHTDLILDLVNILYRIGRSIFITLLQYAR